MSFPKRGEIEVSILIELDAMGGEAKTDDIYPRVAKHFPQITAEELTQRFGIGEKKWTNLVRWVKLGLSQNGDVVSSSKGVWRMLTRTGFL